MSLATRESESQVGQETMATIMTEASAPVCFGNSSPPSRGFQQNAKIKASVPVRLGRCCHHLHAASPATERQQQEGDKAFHTLTEEVSYQQLPQRGRHIQAVPTAGQTAPSEKGSELPCNR